MKQLKNSILIFTLFFASSVLIAQGVVVTDDASYAPGTSAILDVNSNAKGLLPPRMSTAERDAISKPAEGLIIFNTTCKALEIYDSTGWSSPTSKFICGSTQIADTSGNIYNTIKIGGQCWMAENLNTGLRIDGANNQSDNTTLEKYCYNNSEDNCDLFGALYQWDEIMQYVSTNGIQGICPDEWHIPTDAEWCLLEKEVDLTIDCSSNGWRGLDAGIKLIQGGISGFAALFSGDRNTSASFENIASDAYFWTSTSGTSGAWSRNLRLSENGVARNEISKDYALSIRCVKNIKVLPVVTTDSASNITSSSADCAGEITDIGWSTVTQYGHCWSTSSEPTIDDDLFNLGISDTTGVFISNIHDLASYTTYYVRAYAINSEGVSYSVDTSFTTAIGNGASCPGVATITYGGQLYNTVLIGNQCWLRENLNIGTMINGGTDQSNNATLEKYCYNNTASNCDTYGGLYQWNEMMQYTITEGAQGICPDGWHLPTDVEWCLLQQYLDEAETDCSPPADYPVGIDAAGQLKAMGSTYWNSPNMAATNSSGFTAMPGGMVNSNTFESINFREYFWTSSEFNATNARGRLLYSHLAYISRFIGLKAHGYSVRCVKD